MTFDGMAMATDDDDSRQVNLEAIPGSAVSRLEVYKESTPDMDGHGIGGSMNLVSLSAYDKVERYVQLNADLSQYSRHTTPNDKDGLGHALSFTFADKFGDDNQWGIVASASDSMTDRDAMKYISRYFYLDEDEGGNYKAFKKEFETYNDSKIKKKSGGMLKLEYLSGNVYSYLNTFYYKKRMLEDSWYWKTQVPKEEFAFLDENGGGYATQGKGVLEFFTRDTNTDNGGVHFHIDAKFSDVHEIVFDASLGRANYRRPEFAHLWKTNRAEELGFSYEDSTVHSAWQFNDPSFASDGSNYSLDNLEETDVETDDRVVEFKLDYRFNLDESPEGWGFGFGAKQRNDKRRYNKDKAQYTADFLLSQFQADDPFTPEWFSTSLPVVDHDAVRDHFNAYPEEFDINDPYSYRETTKSDFSYSEDVLAYYSFLSYSAERWSLSGGLRYERTKLSSAGILFDKSDDIFYPHSVDADYENVLPSINFNYDLSQNLVFRFSLSEIIARPDPGDLKARESFDEDGFGNLYISQRNKNLKPRISKNIGFSLEYYFDGIDAMATLAGFHSEIDNLPIETVQTLYDDPGPGLFTEITSKQNADFAELTGFEINVVKNSMSFLPELFHGLGMSVNATVIDAELTYRNDENELTTIDHLFEQPSSIVNASVFHRFMGARGELRLAYQYTGEYSESLVFNGRARNEYIWDAYEQWDLNFRYAVMDGLILKVKVRNLTDHYRNKLRGINQELTVNETYFGRNVSVGFSYLF